MSVLPEWLPNWPARLLGSVALAATSNRVKRSHPCGYDLLGGFIGAVLTGLFCSTLVNPGGADGYFTVRWQEARLKTLEDGDKKLIADAKAKDRVE